MQAFYTLIYAISSCFSILLAFIVFIQNPNSRTNRIFTLFIVSIVAWIVSLYAYYALSSHIWVLFVGRLNFAFALLLGYILFIFSYYFPIDSLKLNSFSKTLLFIFTTFFFGICLFTPLVDANEIINGASRSTLYGPFYLPFIAYFLLMLLTSLIILFLKYKHSYSIERNQLKFLFLGLLISLIFAIFTNIIIPLVTGDYDTQNLGAISPVFLIAFISYAIIKHRLMDIRLVIARTVAYTLLVITLGTIYISGFFLGARYVFGTSTSKEELYLSTVLAIIMAFSFQPLRKFLEKATNKIFFKNIYNVNDLLKNLSHIMASTLSLDNLGEYLIQELINQMQIMSGHLILLKDSKIIWKKSLGTDLSDTFNEDVFTKLLQEVSHKITENILIFDELQESPIKQIMRENHINIFIPLVVKDEQIGALLLGDKSSGDIYSIEDINVFKIIESEIAVAIKNALSYEEIKNFNVTLEKEVLHATEKLKHANEKLTELDKLKDEFVSIASHELRTPMTAIKSYLWMALFKSPGKMEPTQKHYLEIAYSSTEQLLKLVQDMLTISRIEGNRIELQLEVFNLNDLVHDMYDELKIKADEQHIEMRYVSHPLHCMVYADKARMREVVLNLLGNALKFTPEKGSINISVLAKDDKVVTSVSDTGPGISKIDIPKLFQKFARIASSYKNQSSAVSGGTGLGLYITKQIVELHKGHIQVESEVGKGSTFSFILPEYHKE